jgi:hypothetical protein
MYLASLVIGNEHMDHCVQDFESWTGASSSSAFLDEHILFSIPALWILIATTTADDLLAF